MNLLSFIRNLGYIQSIYYSEYFHKEIHKISSSKDKSWDFFYRTTKSCYSLEKIQLINIRMESRQEKPKNRPKLPPTAATMAAKSYKRISV